MEQNLTKQRLHNMIHDRSKVQDILHRFQDEKHKLPIITVFFCLTCVGRGGGGRVRGRYLEFIDSSFVISII